MTRAAKRPRLRKDPRLAWCEAHLGQLIAMQPPRWIAVTAADGLVAEATTIEALRWVLDRQGTPRREVLIAWSGDYGAPPSKPTGPTRAAKRPTPQLSDEERAKRRPPPPASLLAAEDTIRVPPGRLIKATPIRTGPACDGAETGCGLYEAGESPRCTHSCGWKNQWIKR